MAQTVSETLHLAADLIEERGWHTGTWSLDGPLCIEGAIIAAMGATSGLDALVGRYCPAANAVHEYLGVTPYQWNDDLPWERVSITRANGTVRVVDAYVGGSEATALAFGKARVLEVLRATALIEASRERESAAVSA